MLLLVDIGNTSTTYGYYNGKRITRVGHVSTDGLPIIVMKLIKEHSSFPDNYIILTSVVPKITKRIRKLWSEIRGKRGFWVAGDNLKVPISHKYLRINELGSDRLINAYGAIRIYAPPLLIFDFGTALTCDYISEKGVFQGGLIIPGAEISLKALSECAALLPQIDFPKGNPSIIIGRDTREGMKAGILQGYGAMTDGLIERFRARFGRKFRVIATGGLARVIRPYSHRIDIVDPLLTLKSLVRVFKDQVKIPS